MKLRKKILAMALVGAMLLLAGCGSGGDTSSASAESENAPAETLNLEGSWIAEVQGSDYYLAGFIKDNLIELHWVSSYDQNGSVYWAGSYKAPKDKPDTYTWESTRNDPIMNTSAYASVDASRSFTYADGKLTLAGSSTGAETVLIPSETDYSYLAVEVSEEEQQAAEDAAKAAEAEQASADAIRAAEEEEVEDIVLVDSGYSVESLGGGNSLIYYAVEIENPNTYNAIVSPNIDITVLDKDGRVLTKQNRSLFAVAPGDRFFFGDAINCPKGSPADVEITVENNDYDFKTFEGSGIHSVKDFSVGEVSEEKEGGQVHFSGTITNDSAADLENVIATVVFKKDGSIVGGVTGEIGSMAAGESADFDIATKSDFSDYDSYEVYVTQEAA